MNCGKGTGLLETPATASVRMEIMRHKGGQDRIGLHCPPVTHEQTRKTPPSSCRQSGKSAIAFL